MQRIHRSHSHGKPQEVYVGRATKMYPASPLANPFRLMSYDTAGRLEAVGKYRQWLWNKIQNQNPVVLQALRTLKEESTLVCYCHKNEACHADVIMSAWKWLRSKGLLTPAAPAEPYGSLAAVVHLA